MPRLCSVCTHADHRGINAALVAGEPLRDVARQYGVSKDALFRHRSDHIPAHLATAREAETVAADDLLREVRALRGKAISLLLQAEAAGDIRTALAGIREARGCLELLAKLLGELDERPTINVLVAPEWLAVRATLIDALAPYPDARAAVSGRLVALGAGT